MFFPDPFLLEIDYNNHLANTSLHHSLMLGKEQIHIL